MAPDTDHNVAKVQRRMTSSGSFKKWAYFMYGISWSVGIGFEIPRDALPHPWPPAPMASFFMILGLVLHFIGSMRGSSD